MDSQPLVNRAPWSEVSQKSLGANRRRVLLCPFADSLQPLGPALPCGSHRPVDPLGKFLGVQLRRALDRIGAPARFIAAVTLTGVAFFGAAFFAM
jgi:hypothetical protein